MMGGYFNLKLPISLSVKSHLFMSLSEYRMDNIQWIVIAISAFLVTTLLADIGARVIFNYGRAQLNVQPNVVVIYLT